MSINLLFYTQEKCFAAKQDYVNQLFMLSRTVYPP